MRKELIVVSSIRSVGDSCEWLAGEAHGRRGNDQRVGTVGGTVVDVKGRDIRRSAVDVG